MDFRDRQRDIKNKRAFATFISWVNENGSSFPNIQFKLYGKNERGVHSKSYLRTDRNLIKIPRSLIIHDGMAKDIKHGARLIEHGVHKNQES